jgi:hypothetical protein
MRKTINNFWKVCGKKGKKNFRMKKSCTVEKNHFSSFLLFFPPSFFHMYKILYVWLQLGIRNKESNLEFLESPSFMFSFFIYHLFCFRYFSNWAKSLFSWCFCRTILLLVFFSEIIPNFQKKSNFALTDFRITEKIGPGGFSSFHENRLIYCWFYNSGHPCFLRIMGIHV